MLFIMWKDFLTVHETPSLHGGKVREPLYLEQRKESLLNKSAKLPSFLSSSFCLSVNFFVFLSDITLINQMSEGSQVPKVTICVQILNGHWLTDQDQLLWQSEGKLIWKLTKWEICLPEMTRMQEYENWFERWRNWKWKKCENSNSQQNIASPSIYPGQDLSVSGSVSEWVIDSFRFWR